jgi:hypothetical protein
MQPVSRWLWVDEYEMPCALKCLSVGFLVAYTKEGIALAPNMGDLEHERHQASGIIRIPRSAVQKIRDLTPKR